MYSHPPMDYSYHTPSFPYHSTIDTTPITPSFPSFPWELFTPCYTHVGSSPSLYLTHGYSPHSPNSNPYSSSHYSYSYNNYYQQFKSSNTSFTIGHKYQIHYRNRSDFEKFLQVSHIRFKKTTQKKFPKSKHEAFTGEPSYSFKSSAARISEESPTTSMAKLQETIRPITPLSTYRKPSSLSSNHNTKSSNPTRRISEPNNHMRRSFTGNPFSKPSSLKANPRSNFSHTSANSPIDFSRESFAYEQENVKDHVLRPGKIRSTSPAVASKLSNNFMCPTISASFKVVESPRRQILTERNETALSSEHKIHACKVTFTDPLEPKKLDASIDGNEIPFPSFESDDMSSENLSVSDAGSLFPSDDLFEKVPMNSPSISHIVIHNNSLFENISIEPLIPQNETQSESSFENVSIEPDFVNLDPTFKLSPTVVTPPVSYTHTVVAYSNLQRSLTFESEHGDRYEPVAYHSDSQSSVGLPRKEIKFPMAQGDFSTFLYKYGSYPGYFDIVVNQFDNISKADREDIKREIHILQHLSGQPNIVESEGAYEDRFSLHLVIELCAGGELFDRIIAQGHYSERAAARIFRAIVNVVHNCHFIGVLHLDLKPGNLLLSSKDEGSALKATDFGLSVYIEEGKVYRDMVGSAYYVARHHFNHGVFHDAADFAIPPKPPDSPLLSIYNTIIELAVRGDVNFRILKGDERYDEGRTDNKGKVVESEIEVVAANGTRCPAVGVSMLRLVKYTSVLLPPLEAFCRAKKTCVRDKAVESLCQIGSQMRESDLVEYFIPLVKRLAAGEWFSAQVSACVLSHIAHPTAPAITKTGLRSIYTQLCQDDMPMVRRSDATSLGKFAATVEYTHFKADIMSIFNNSALGKLLEPQDCVAHILLVMVNFSQDKLWRVFYMVANQLFELCEAVGQEPTGSELVPAYVGLLHDNEAEVRIAAAGKVTKFCWILCPIKTTLDAVESSYMRKLIFQILEFVLQIISDNLLFKQWDPGTISLLSY